MQESKTTHFKHKVDSEHKLWIRFKDGNIRHFYSLDWKNSKSNDKHMEIGLKRLFAELDKHLNAGKVEKWALYHVPSDKKIRGNF